MNVHPPILQLAKPTLAIPIYVRIDTKLSRIILKPNITFHITPQTASSITTLQILEIVNKDTVLYIAFDAKNRNLYPDKPAIASIHGIESFLNNSQNQNLRVTDHLTFYPMSLKPQVK
jgi:hypothetical protein